MDNLDIKNLQLSYQAVYDQTLCESMEDLGIIGEDRDGYGDDSKFNKPDDKIEKPGTTVPKPKKGGYGRISRSTPYGIGAHANRTQSAVTKTVGEDPGAPRAVKMANDKPKPKRVIPSRKKTEEDKPKAKKVIPSRFDKADFELWLDELINEGYDLSEYTWDDMAEIYMSEGRGYYDIILSYLLDEGYADDINSAEAIMVNMSEDWVGEIVENYGIMRAGVNKSGQTVGMSASGKEPIGDKLMRKAGSAIRGAFSGKGRLQSTTTPQRKPLMSKEKPGPSNNFGRGF